MSAERLTATAKRLYAAIPDPVLEWPRRIVEIDGIDRAMVVGAQAFTAFFPLAIVASAVISAHGGADVAAGFVEHFDLEGSARDSVEAVFAAPSDVRSEIQVFGAIVLVPRRSRSFARSSASMSEPGGCRGAVCERASGRWCGFSR